MKKIKSMLNISEKHYMDMIIGLGYPRNCLCARHTEKIEKKEYTLNFSRENLK